MTRSFHVLLAMLLTAYMCSCSADYSVVEKDILEAVSDSFVQANKMGELDILVVLDTSGSMSDNFETVGEGMQTLKVDIELLTDDYRFGFITADSGYTDLIGPYDRRSTDIDLLMAPSMLRMRVGRRALHQHMPLASCKASINFLEKRLTCCYFSFLMKRSRVKLLLGYFMSGFTSLKKR